MRRLQRRAPKADTEAPAPPKPTPEPKPDATPKAAPAQAPVETPAAPPQPAAAPRAEGDRVKASPLARRLAQAQNIDLSSLQGSGPGGRIVRADVDAAAGKAPAAPGAPAAAPALGTHVVMPGPIEQAIPHEAVKLSNMRKTIARRLTEAKQQVPHIYLTVDIQLDALLKLRGELNKGLESRGIKLSVNDLLIKALAAALIEVPECNVSFAGRSIVQIQPRRHLGRGVDPRRPDHSDHRRRRGQERLRDLDRDEGARRPRQGGQAPAAAISGRHREPLATWACTGSSSSRR